MSIHDPSSDLSFFNDHAHLGPTEPHPLTAQVIRFCLELTRASGGIFDPARGADGDLGSAGFVHELRPGVFVASAQVRLDFGGVAKGFAVDQAIDALIACGACSGTVNAGGDIRSFGSGEQSVLLRLPEPVAGYLSGLSLNDEALAVSVPKTKFSEPGGERSRIVDGRTGAVPAGDMLIAVAAPTCMVADAMTKLAVFADGCSPGLFERYGAAVRRVRCGASPAVERLCDHHDAEARTYGA